MKPGYIQLTAKLTLGTPKPISIKGRTTREWFKAHRLIINVPIPGFAVLEHLYFGKLDAFITSDDMYYFHPSSMGTVDLPTITNKDPIAIEGVYTGAIPPEFTKGEDFYLYVMLFEGISPTIRKMLLFHENVGEQVPES